jgi:hypothetical protein
MSLWKKGNPCRVENKTRCPMNRLGSDSKNLQPDKLFVAYNQHKRKQ